jgi:type IV pilus assembly protein PilQ
MMTRFLRRILATALLVGPGALQAQDNARITVTFDKTPMADVVAIFSDYSGTDMILGPGIEALVDAKFHDKPWQEAFQAVLASHGLSVAEMPGGILRIDAPGQLVALDSIERLDTEMVRLNYAKAALMVLNIAPMLTRDRGQVIADTGLNGLIITDTRTKLPRIVAFAKSLDIRTPTVAIMAKLIFVDRTDLEQLGFKYDLGTSDQFFNRLVQRIDPLTGQPYNPNTQVVNLGGNAMSAITNADAVISGSALELAFTTAIGGFSLTSFLSALERVELTDVEARPVIHVLDNHEAYILSGEETPVRVIDASSFGQVNQAPRANVQFKETGIRLRVRPSVTASREVRMDIEAERSSIQTLAAADLGFTIPKQITQTSLLVRDGETAVIGGLTTTTVTRNRSGVPLLSSLPFVGSLFSFNENRESRKELIVMVTPRILDDPME